MTISTSSNGELTRVSSFNINLIPLRYSKIGFEASVKRDKHSFKCMIRGLVLLANNLWRISQASFEVLTFPNMMITLESTEEIIA